MSQQQCLPFSKRRKRKKCDVEHTNIVRISDLDTIDALAYLASVNAQASRLPDVFVSARNNGNETISRTESTFVPIDGSLAASQYLTSHRTMLVLPPTRQHLPRCMMEEMNDSDITMREWIDLTLSNFKALGVYADRCQQAGLGGHDYERLAVPLSKDKSGWHVFCLGKDEASGNVGGYFHDTNEDEVGNTENDHVIINTGKGVDEIDYNRSYGNGWDISTVPPKGHPPSTKLICQFDQVLTRRVLSHHVYYVTNGWALTRSRGAWVYALLSMVEKPLHREEASMLRGLLRELCRLRAGIDIHTEKNKAWSNNTGLLQYYETLALLNILITVVGIYFEQGECLYSIMTFQHST